MTTSRSRGISRSMFFKLWTRAPLMTIWPGISSLTVLQLFQLILDDVAVLFEFFWGLGLESEDQGGLGVGGANQPPTF